MKFGFQWPSVFGVWMTEPAYTTHSPMPKGSGELKRHMGEFVTRRMTFEWEQPPAYIELCKLEEQDAQSIRGPKSVSLSFFYQNDK